MTRLEFDALIRATRVICDRDAEVIAAAIRQTGEHTVPRKRKRGSVFAERVILKKRFSNIFGRAALGPEESRFLQQTAPDAIFYCVRYDTFKNRSDPRESGATVEDKQRENIIRDPPIVPKDGKSRSPEDAVMNDAHEDSKVEERLTSGPKEQGEHEPESAIVETANGIVRVEENLEEDSDRPARRRKTIAIDLSDEVTSTTEETDSLSSDKALLEQAAEAYHDKAVRRSTPDVSPANERIFVDVFPATTKVRVIRLEMKYLVEDGTPDTYILSFSLLKLETRVRQCPLGIWPTRMLFIYVCGDDDSNIPTFNQDTLQTASDDWVRIMGTGKAVDKFFRLYVNDHDDAPPMIKAS